MKNILRISGYFAAFLVLAAIIAVAAIYLVTDSRIGKTYAIAPVKIDVPTGGEALARGKHLVDAIGLCGHCHGDDLAGNFMIDDPAMGRIYATNLTPGKGSRMADYSDEQLARALRHSIDPGGKSLLFMPSAPIYHLSDTDLGAMIAYLRSLKPVDKPREETEIKFMGRFLTFIGALPLLHAEHIDHTAKRIPSPPPGATVEYGAYLAVVAGCTDCHGPGLSGGQVPGTPPDFPPATNITPAALGSWSEANFIKAMREGEMPDGSGIDPFMPWEYSAKFTDDELKALWMYLKTVPPRETGNM